MSISPPFQFISRYILLSFILLLSFGCLQAQGKQDESMAGRIKRATTLIHSQQLVEARPLLVKLRSEVDAGMHANLDFYIALSYVFEYYENNNQASLDTGLEKFQTYIKAYPEDSMVPLARYNIADIYAISKKFKEALQWYIPLYKSPQVGVDRKEILKKIVLIYVAKQEWVSGMPYFEASVRFAENGAERTTYAAYLLIAQAKQGAVTDSRQLLEFFKSPAPVFFTPRFNAALMDVGDQLKEEGDLATASLFYQFVRYYETLEVGLTNHISHLKRRVAQYEGNVVMRNFYIDAKTELDNAVADLAALKATTNYTPLLNWRIAGVYMDMGRDWEAYGRFRLMVDQYPDHKYAEEILFSAYSLGYKLEQRDIAEELSRRYLGKQSNKTYRATVADEMSTLYLIEEEYDELYTMTQTYLSHSAGDAASSLLLFKHGMARLRRFENKELIEDFQTFDTKYGQTQSAVVIRYFLGLSYLIEEESQKALDNFEFVIADSNTRFKADASFRKALAVMGLDRIEEARDLVTQFITDYPNNPLRGQAELILGNLVDLMGNADEALVHYYLVEQHSDDLGLIASAELKISRILVDKREMPTAIDRLSAFIEAHEASAETIPVVAALAEIYSDLGQPRVALSILKDPLTRFFTLIEVEKIDTLLVDYIKKDRAVREMEIATKAFFEAVADSPELFRELINDRAKQYRYFKEHTQIDALAREHFVGDDVFRNAVKAHYKKQDEIEAAIAAAEAAANSETSIAKSVVVEELPPIMELEVVTKLQARIAELNEKIPKQTADEWLGAQLADAKLSANTALELRIQAALAKTQAPEGSPSVDTALLFKNSEIWAQLGIAGKLWILREVAKQDPIQVVAELGRSRIQYMNTDYELEMHSLLAKTYRGMGQLEASVEAYRTLIKRFSQANESGEAMLEIGLMEIELGNYESARQQLELILHRNDWRGQMHGDALLWIGRAYVAEEKYSEAHGFFERIMLGYPGFSELLAQGYYEDIQVLKKMGHADSVQTVYEAFKLTPGLKNTIAGALIRKEFE